MNVEGVWSAEWAPVIDAFAANFNEVGNEAVNEGGEKGAGVAIFHRGQLVVNIWAGERTNRIAEISGQPWNADTLVNIFSAGKGLVALCILQLVAQGKLELDAPVARYWLEFAAMEKATVNKATIKVGDILCHRSGLSAFHQHVPAEHIFQWREMTTAIELEAPWWEPGTAQGYSPFMYGWILGELIKRVSGVQSFNDYFQENVAKPLKVNCHFGVPEHLLADIADTSPLKRMLSSSQDSNDADSVSLGKIMKADPRGVTNRAFSNPLSLMTATNTIAWRKAQIPAANAHANAAALATIYGDLANGGALLPKQILPLCSQQRTFEQDRVLGLPLRFSYGFMLSQHHRADCRYGRGENAFGHPGAGGCVGFADPDFKIGFGYVTQRMGQSLLIDERAVRLIDSVYKVLSA